MRTQHPDFLFETGLCLWRSVDQFGTRVHRRDWLVVGRLDDGTPFLLSYSEPGVTNWWCAKQLGPGLRKKVLGRLRKEARFAKEVPNFVEVQDLRAEDEQEWQAGIAQAERLTRTFFDGVWRARYLGERDEDYVDLDVPFEQREAAKRAGARWDATRKRWRVRRQEDMTAFSAWLSLGTQSTESNAVAQMRPKC